MEMQKYQYHDVNFRGTIERVTYQTTNPEGEPRTKYANVYLPYGYDESKQYNIFYLMHGGGENENTIFSSDVKLNNILDHMIMNGQIGRASCRERV